MLKDPGSFRDPSGQVFEHDGQIFRQVFKLYAENYDLLIGSGLYKSLLNKGLIIEHQEVNIFGDLDTNNVYKILSPERVPFISYPSEWCFGQLKDAAIATLDIQIESLKFGMVLKDASAFNIQYIGNQPKLIDTLSFETYKKGTPWQAYKQFCEHFLSPLILFSKVDIGFHSLLATSLTGIPLALTTQLLPWHQKIRPSVFTHLVMHAKAQRKYEDEKIQTTNSLFTVDYLLFLARSLKKLIESLHWEAPTQWGSYYDKDVLPAYFEEKEKVIGAWIFGIGPQTMWDLGANDGAYSQLGAKLGIQVRSMDVDLGAVEKNYLKNKKERNPFILPLVSNLSMPTPAFGWGLTERKSLFEREHPDLVIALGLLHHLVITEGVPLEKVSALFSDLSNELIIEFIPKHDPKVVKLLQNRADVFATYTEQDFLNVFNQDFELVKSIRLTSGVRSLYHFKSKKQLINR
jgi:hypothetical protein